MTRTFRQIINMQTVKVLDVESDVFIDAELVSYKPDTIIVLFPNGSEVELYHSADTSNLYHGYIHDKEYTCQL